MFAPAGARAPAKAGDAQKRNAPEFSEASHPFPPGRGARPGVTRGVRQLCTLLLRRASPLARVVTVRAGVHIGELDAPVATPARHEPAVARGEPVDGTPGFVLVPRLPVERDTAGDRAQSLDKPMLAAPAPHLVELLCKRPGFKLGRHVSTTDGDG